MAKITYDEIKAKRAQYMDNEITHDEYYSWLAEQIRFGVPQLTMTIKEKEIRASTDKWFNDIPLRRWDNLDSYVRHCARMTIKGTFSWSLSDSVCVAKAVARQIRGN